MGPPGFTVHGMDIGKWLATQHQPEVRETLTDGQRERLEAIGVIPAAFRAAEEAREAIHRARERLRAGRGGGLGPQ